MSPARTFFAALAVTAFLACEPVLEPEVSVAVSSLAFSEIENDDRFDMNDRFSGSGANGRGRAEEEDGELELRLDINDLIADHPYEVHVIVGPQNIPIDLDDLIDVHVFPVTADEDGKLRFEVEFDLGLDPGEYRLDYVVVHDDEFPPFPENLVVACEPASFFTIGDKSDKSK